MKFALVLLSVLAPLASHPPEDLVPDSARSRLVMAADEVAKLGQPALVEEMAELLARAGEPAAEIDDRRTRWERSLEKAKSPVRDSARRGVARRVEAAVKVLEKEAADRDDASAFDLAELILELDSQSEVANDILGREKIDGRFVGPLEAQLDARAREINAAIDEAMRLEVEVEHVSPSPSEFVRDLRGEDSHAVKARGIVLHGGVSPDRLERALRQGLRALAVSVWLETGEVELPRFKPELELFFTNDIPEYENALDLADSTKRIEADMLRLAKAGSGTGSFPTKKDVYVVRWCPETHILADVIWFGTARIMPPHVEPYLIAGHSNWLCLRFAGTSKPGVAWLDAREADERSRVDPRGDDDAMLRAASSGLFGARSYLRRKIDAGDSVTLADSVLDQEGLVTGVELLVATIVTDYMQLTGELWGIVKSKRESDESRLRGTERALGMSIPEYDERWQAWLMGRSAGAGILQRVEGAEPEQEFDPRNDPTGKAAHDYLTEIREAAFGPLRLWTESLGHYPELSANAEKHAAYLQINTDQKQSWPEAHEEFADSEGFSPEGAWAGGHSVIAFNGDIEGAIDGWMATFYHRLPLLEPGLCGVGAAVDDDVVVMDTGSLLNEFQGPAHVKWPHEDQRDVPLAWQPELPNPVPDEDQSGWGYPITVQSYWGPEGQDASIVLSLFNGDEKVDCHFISPTTAKFDRLIPANAYCLIPKDRLDANTTYRVVADVQELEETWEWTFKTGSRTY